MRIEVAQIKRGKYKGQWRFALIADNGEKIDPRQPYNDKRDALHAVDLIVAMDASTEIVVKG